jgi:hypothetical protein
VSADPGSLQRTFRLDLEPDTPAQCVAQKTTSATNQKPTESFHFATTPVGTDGRASHVAAVFAAVRIEWNGLVTRAGLTTTLFLAQQAQFGPDAEFHGVD